MKEVSSKYVSHDYIYNIQDLKDVTHDVHYENYRISCLSELKAKGISVSGDTSSPATADRKLKRESVNYGAAATGESEYEDPETLMLLQQKDQEIKKMQVMIEQMQQKLKASN